MKKLVVVSAGVSDPSTTRILADRIAEAVEAQVSKRGEGVQVEYVELRELAVSLGTVSPQGFTTKNCAPPSILSAVLMD